MKKQKYNSKSLPKDAFLAAQYEIVLVSDETDGEFGYMAKCEELRGLTGFGATPTDAVRDFNERKAEWYDDAIEAQVPVPLPSSQVERAFSGRFILRIDPHLHQSLHELAEAEGSSLNSQCESLLKSAVREKLGAKNYSIQHIAGEISELKAALHRMHGDLSSLNDHMLQGGPRAAVRSARNVIVPLYKRLPASGQKAKKS